MCFRVVAVVVVVVVVFLFLFSLMQVYGIVSSIKVCRFLFELDKIYAVKSKSLLPSIIKISCADDQNDRSQFRHLTSLSLKHRPLKLVQPCNQNLSYLEQKARLFLKVRVHRKSQIWQIAYY